MSFSMDYYSYSQAGNWKNVLQLLTLFFQPFAEKTKQPY